MPDNRFYQASSRSGKGPILLDLAPLGYPRSRDSGAPISSGGLIDERSPCVTFMLGRTRQSSSGSPGERDPIRRLFCSGVGVKSTAELRRPSSGTAHHTFLQGSKIAQQLFIRGQHLAQPNLRYHDLDVHFDSPLAVDSARELCHSPLDETVRPSPEAHLRCGHGDHKMRSRLFKLTR